MYYWEIRWKKYGEAYLYVTDKQKEFIEEEWIKTPDQRKNQQFKINGEYYSYDSIEGIQRSTKKIESNLKQLYAGDAPKVRRAPLTTVEDGYDVIVTQWVKKYISQKEYEQHYSKHSHYRILSKEDSSVWIAIRVPVYEDGYLPDDCEPCDEAESDRLWKSLKDY